MEEEEVVEVGTAVIPSFPKERGGFGLLGDKRYSGLRGGTYRVFARVRPQGVDLKSVTLVKGDTHSGYDVCADVPIAKLAENKNTLVLSPQLASFDQEKKELTVTDAFLQESRHIIAGAAADLVVPGLSLVARVGEVAEALKDKGNVEGEYRGKSGESAIIERDDHSLIGVEYDVAFSKLKDGDRVSVSKDGDEISVKKVEGGRSQAALKVGNTIESSSALSRDLFGG